MPANTLNKKRNKAAENALLTNSAITPPAQINTSLPDGWRWVKLGDISEKVASIKRTNQKPNREFFYLDIGGIDNARNKIVEHKVYTWNTAPSRAQQIIKKDDILFSTVRTYMKNIAIIDREIYNDQIASSGFCVIRAKKEQLIPKYIFYLTLSNSFLQPLNELQTGSSYPAVRDKDVFSQKVPLPSIDVQHAIVSKIEELLSELDKGKQQLETAQQQLKVYRQAVLKWAFEGRLTNENVKEGELPEGWRLKGLKEITTVLGDGLHGTPKYSETGEYYFINGNNLTDGRIEIKENTKKVDEGEYEKYKKPLNDKTILVSINGTLGYTAFYNNERVVLGKSACYFNVIDGVDKYFVRHYLTSNKFKRYADESATGSTIKNVGLKAMREFLVPLPPTIAEQKHIVEEIESRLSVCDKLEETINQSLAQAETLRQSILKRAFEGKLV